MSSIQSKAVEIARGHVGYKEGKRNWSIFARDSFPTVQNQAWCGSFVGDVYKRAGFNIGAHVWVPYVPYVETWAKRIGAWKTSRAQLGDLTVYGFGKSSAQHIGIAWPDEGSSEYRAVEGNTSSSNAGSQSNGDGVYVRYRRRAQIRGWVDMAKVLKHYGVTSPAPAPSKPAATPSKPAVATEKAPAFPLTRKPGAMYFYGDADGPKTSVSGKGLNTGAPKDVVKDASGKWYSKGLKTWQARMKKRGWSIDVDGRYGVQTEKVVRAFQKSKGLKVDGQIGPTTWAAAWTEKVV